MQLTVSQAARAAGKSKSQISRMVKNGRISADHGVDKRPLIEASELLRVYPDADLDRREATQATPASAAQGNKHNPDLLRMQLDLARADLDRERSGRDADRLAAVEREAWLRTQVEAAQRQLPDQRPGGWLRRIFGSD